MGKRVAVDENSWTPVDVSMDLGVNGFKRQAAQPPLAVPEYGRPAAPAAVLDEVVPVRAAPPAWALEAARTVEHAREAQARRVNEAHRAAQATHMARAAQVTYEAEAIRTSEIELILMAGLAAQTPAEGIGIGHQDSSAWGPQPAASPVAPMPSAAPMQRIAQMPTAPVFEQAYQPSAPVVAQAITPPVAQVAIPPVAQEAIPVEEPESAPFAPAFDSVSVGNIEDQEDEIDWDELHSPRRARDYSSAHRTRAWTLVGLASALAAGGIVTMGVINPQSSDATVSPKIAVTSGKGTPLESDDGETGDDEVTAGSKPSPTDDAVSIELTALWGVGNEALGEQGKAVLPFTVTAGAGEESVEAEVTFELPSGIELLNGPQGDCTSVEQTVTCSGIELAPESSFEGTVGVLISTSGHELPAMTTVAKPQA